MTSFRRGNEGLRATFKVFQKMFYPSFIQFRIDIVDEEKWIIIRWHELYTEIAAKSNSNNALRCCPELPKTRISRPSKSISKSSR